MSGADLDLAYLSAGEQAAAVAGHLVSPVELVDNALARIAEVNPALNCFAFVWDDQARAEAEAAAAAVASDAPIGPLHGVPIALKDTTPTAGRTTTLGSHAFAGWVPDTDATIIGSLRRAGAIIVGKTTTPEFAHALITDSPLWGPTRNPWNPQRTPGGSSGGSAAAVASGCVALAEGSDMGGSVRIPAAWCGVAGLKPGIGRIPMDVLPGLYDQISHHGPLARTVDDVRRFLAVTQGPSLVDLWSQPVPLPLDDPVSGSVEGLSIGWSTDLGRWTVDPAIVAAVEATAAALADAGAVVVPVEVPLTGEEELLWARLWWVFMATYYGALLEKWGDRMSPAVVKMIRRGRELSAVDLKTTEIERTAVWQRFRPVFERHDVLLCPTMAAGPVGPTLADWVDPDPDPDRNRSPDMTSVFNLIAPCPALSVPVGRDGDGLPIGAQLVGRPWREDVVLTVGSAVERLMPPLGRPTAVA
ncbi:MAG: amidase [Acidimicrobiales bacterium]